MISRLIGNPWAILALIAALGAGGAYLRVSGYNAGYAASEAAHAAATRALNDKLAVVDERSRVRAAEADRLAREKTELERKLAYEAATDPDFNSPGISGGLLRGINAIR